MELIKMFTTNTFRKHDFVEMLRSVNVNAVALTDGVGLDREAFNNAMVAGVMPMWGKAVADDVNNNLKTRAMDIQEWPGRKVWHFSLYLIRDIENVELLGGTAFEDLRQTGEYCKANNIPFVIVDNFTGEALMGLNEGVEF